LSQEKKVEKNTKYVIEKNTMKSRKIRMGRTKIMIEYKQTGRDADVDNTAGMGWGQE